MFVRPEKGPLAHLVPARPNGFGRSGGERLDYMSYTVYVLIDRDGKLYKGVTNDLRRRLAEHRSGHANTTSRMHDIQVAYTEKFDTFEVARERELYFKSAAGRRFLKKHLGP